MKKTLLVLATVALSTSVMAQTSGKYYSDVMYGAVTMKDTSSSSLGSFNTSLARLSFGSVVADNLAVEGFITQGLASDSKTIQGVKVELKTKTGYAVAIRPFIKANENIEIFGRLGYMNNEAELTASANGRSASLTKKSTRYMYGVGATYKINSGLSAVVDYTSLENKEEADVSLLSIGLRFNF